MLHHPRSHSFILKSKFEIFVNVSNNDLYNVHYTCCLWEPDIPKLLKDKLWSSSKGILNNYMRVHAIIVVSGH